MAQSGYSSYYPQASYTYPTPPSQPQTTQGYDPRMQPQYSTHYQQPSYVQQTPQHQAPQYVQTPAAPIHRPPSRINPVAYAPGQLTGPMTAPLPQVPQAQLYGQYFPPRSPQPYHQAPPSNPYPSPVSPQTPQSGTPQSARRPLPDPRGLPAPPVNGQGFPSPQQTPSPGPVAGPHRPIQSVSNVNAFPPHPPSNALTRIPSSQGGSPTPSPFAASTSPPRPLPLPRSAGSFDLANSQSQPQVQPQPQSPPKRALPAPQPPSPSVIPEQPAPVRSPEPLPASGQKFVPLWKRALPQPGESAPARTPQPSQIQAPVERRSTVSGGARPLPSPSASKAVGAPVDSSARAGTLPLRLQLQNTPSSSRQPTQPLDPLPRASQPNPSNSNRTPPSPSPTTSSVSSTPSTSRFRERSRTLPLPTAAPNYPLPPEPTAQAQSHSLVGQRISESPVSSDDEELTNALLERHPRSPSPQYGIRELPKNSHPPPANPEAGQPRRARRELPSPVPPSPNRNQEAESSMAMRMANASLRSTSPSPTFRPTHGHSQSLSNNGPARPMPQPPNQSQPQPKQQNGWPSALPPLPRAPGSSNVTPPPASQSTFSQMQASRALPRPTRSNTTAATVTPFSRPRSPRKADLDLSLDDAPPPSLRRSPGPSSAFQLPQARPPTSFNSPLPSAPALNARSQTAPTHNVLQRAPSDATSVFSLSHFPPPPASQPTSPRKNAFRPPSTTKAQQGPPSPTKPMRSQSPVRFQPPPATREQSTPRIPKISFPANGDGDSDEDADGPVINISGPSDANRGGSVPRVSFGDDDGIPVINIGGADDSGPSVPQISLPGEPSSSPPKQSQTRKMQETLSNPRLEAAKRSGLVCGGCGGPIIGRIVSAMDMRWHPGCFRCCVCDELLENLSSYAHEGRPYCHFDYHEVRHC